MGEWVMDTGVGKRRVNRQSAHSAKSEKYMNVFISQHDIATRLSINAMDETFFMS